MNKPPGNGDFDAETLSAWLDGEAHVAPADLDRLLADASLRDKWYHYHLIGDCLAGRCAGPAVEAAPATVPYSQRLRVPLGIAAALVVSVAFAAAMLQPPGDADLVADTSPVAKVQQCRGDCPVPAPDAAELQSAAKRRLASYLVGHSELAAAGTPDAALTYVRIVTQAPHDE